MVQVSYPGVYIQEIPSGVRTITGVSTSIALFVGMASSGPIGKPQRILSFTDYTRIFSADTSLGEMTTQVKQFFLNGGQQAQIVRVASGATPAQIDVKNVTGANAVLRFTAKAEGAAGNQLRVRIDFNTPTPEITFNVTLYRETFDAGGAAQISDLETIPNVSMDSASPRFVTTALNQEATLATATTLGSLPAAIVSYSASARMFNSLANANAAVLAAIGAAGSPAQFNVTLGGVTKTCQVTTTSDVAGLSTAVAAAFPGTSASFVQNASDFGNIIFVGTNTADMKISPAPARDISAALGLGSGVGGLEVGFLATRRPAPNGYVSTTGADATQILALRNFGNLLKTAVSTFVLNSTPPGQHEIGVPTPVPLTYTGSATQMAVEDAAADASLLNIKRRLVTIATAINGATTDWRAEVHGYRLALIPRFGSANAGIGFSVPVSFGGGSSGQIFNGQTSNVAAFSLGVGGSTSGTQANGISGSDGSAPVATNYTDAYAAVDSVVDLFNILVLPKTTIGADIRNTLWPEASAFCNRRRAFLIMDAPTADDTIQEILADVTNLRNGIVKDHTALYWPRISVVESGAQKTVDPSGSVAGIMARIDSTRGVWKAPAGLEADVRGALGLEVLMSDAENGLLNPQAINAIRAFPNGIITWGARTMDGFDNSGNTDFKYVPVRRFELFIEESLVRGLKFAVFEPNDETLWAQIRGAVNGFMNGLFRQGAFAGKKASDAFFVKVDSETTTQQDINLGIVNVVVGFAPLKPAEFVVITIQQQAGQVAV